MLTAIRQSGALQVLSELFALGQRHFLDVVLAAIACWAVVKLHRRPRQLWWFLAAIGLSYVMYGVSRVFWEGFQYLSPMLATAGATNAVGLSIQYGMTLASLVIQGLIWWCVLQAAFLGRNGAETDVGVEDANEKAGA